MKESVYGFYPSARDVWKTHREEVDSYTKECLYRHRNTRFSNNPTATATKQTTVWTSSCPPTTAAPSDGKPHHFNMKRHSDEAVKTPERDTAVETVIPCPRHLQESAANHADSSNNSLRRLPNSSHSTRKWASRLAETSHTDYTKPVQHHKVQSSLEVKPTAVRSVSTPVYVNTERSTHSPTLHESRSALSEIVGSSATVDTGKNIGTDFLATPVENKSQEVTPSEVTKTKLTRSKSAAVRNNSSATVGNRRPVKSAEASLRSQSFIGVTKPTSDKQLSGYEKLVDYDLQLEKYGWRMEVPGDPCHLKRQCLPPRRSTSVVCAIPTPLLPEPRVPVFNSNETFFYGTIPNKPMTFTVHPDFASEQIVARRIELRKRCALVTPGGTKRTTPDHRYPYNTRNFSFIY